MCPPGHVDELWGLAAHPSLPQFVSAGWDRLLQLWDGLSHSTVWSKDIEVPTPLQGAGGGQLRRMFNNLAI